MMTDIPQLATLLGILATGMGLLATIYGFGQKMGKLASKTDTIEVLALKVDALDLKVHALGSLALQVKTLWDFNINGNLLQALNNKIVRQGSDLELAEEFKTLIQTKLPDLPKWYQGFRRAHPNYTKADFFTAIVKDLSPKIMEDICLPMGSSSSGIVTGIQVYCEEFLK